MESDYKHLIHMLLSVASTPRDEFIDRMSQRLASENHDGKQESTPFDSQAAGADFSLKSAAEELETLSAEQLALKLKHLSQLMNQMSATLDDRSLKETARQQKQSK